MEHKIQFRYKHQRGSGKTHPRLESYVNIDVESMILRNASVCASRWTVPAQFQLRTLREAQKRDRRMLLCSQCSSICDEVHASSAGHRSFNTSVNSSSVGLLLQLETWYHAVKRDCEHLTFMPFRQCN